MSCGLLSSLNLGGAVTTILISDDEGHPQQE